MIEQMALCQECKQEFQVNEHGDLVVPFFDMHSRNCERCGQPLKIEHNADGSFGYSCQGHIGGYASSSLYGHSPKYCPYCWKKRRLARSTPCCICQQKKGNALLRHQGYATWGGGTKICLYCHSCEPAFLALPEDEQARHIRAACNLAFPAGQVIYGLVCPEARGVRYVGRTGRPSRRLADHLKDRSDVPGIWGYGKPYEHTWYTRANWMHDLHSRGLQPTMEILLEVPASPTVIEWERRYILHYLQHGWELVNHESQEQDYVARARASRLDFLRTPFDELLQRDFFHDHGIEAFIQAYYRQ